MAEHPSFTAFHRVLKRNTWSGLALARTVLHMVVAAFAPSGPLLTTLTPSKSWSERHDRRHRPVTEWARLMLLTLRRWLPGRSVVAIMGGGFAVLEFLHALRPSMAVNTMIRTAKPVSVWLA